MSAPDFLADVRTFARKLMQLYIFLADFRAFARKSTKIGEKTKVAHTLMIGHGPPLDARQQGGASVLMAARQGVRLFLADFRAFARKSTKICEKKA